MCDYSNYPICDSDIWVNLCLGNIQDELFKKYGKVTFVDVVRDEILRWKSGKYSFIAERFSEKVEQGLALVIKVDDLEDIDKNAIERQLIEDCGYELGFGTPKDKRKNMGEYMSAIMADYYEIPLMKSNDHLFNEGERGKELYPDLEVRNWNTTVVDLIDNIGMRQRIFEKVKKSNDDMNKEKDNYKNGQATLDDILRLKQHFCKD